jgi:CHRD domain
MQRFATALLFSAMFLPAFGDEGSAQEVRSERLLGGNENPPIISDGSGRFRAELLDDRISFRLRYDVASDGSDVREAHLHIANPGNNGGIVAFLCSNVDDPPTTHPDCPDSPGAVNGEIFAEDVMEVTFIEGEPPDETVIVVIEPEDLEGLKQLIIQGSVYANVHTDDHPAGEVRGQVEPRRR